ncbi:hypothetical protein FOZ63_013378, partial [Perkinsus olseni]
YRIKVADKVGAKGGVVITDSFFAKDGRLGVRVSDADKARAKEAASLLGYQTKVLGAIDPELFIREVGDISEEELRDAVGDCCTAVYKKGLNAFVRVRRDGLEDLLSAGIKVGWRLLKPEIRHRKDCPNEAACYKCGLKGHEGRACPGGPPRCVNCNGNHPATDHRAILAKANEMGHCNIRINQINMGRSTVVFQEAIDSLDADIIAIQEPPKLAQCRRILDTAKGDWVLISAQSPSRTAILVKKSVPYRAVRGLVDSRDWVMIDIPCKGTRYSAIRLISGYCPSDGRITMEQCLAGLSDFIDGHHVILCCDSNAWNNS